MGNHTVGNAMGLTALALVKIRQSGQTALELLDTICEPYRGHDAEFESQHPTDRTKVHPDFSDWRDPHPGAALGMLMLEAFAPNGVADLPRYAPMLTGNDEAQDAAYDLWWDKVCEPFRNRYDFC